MDKSQELVLEILNKLINRINQIGETTNVNFEKLCSMVDKINTKPTMVFNSKPIEESISKIMEKNVQVWNIDVGEQLGKFKAALEKSTNDYKTLKAAEAQTLTRKVKLRFWVAITCLLSMLIITIAMNFKQAPKNIQILKNDIKYRYMQSIAKDNFKKQIVTLDSTVQKLTLAEAENKLLKTEGKNRNK